ncbi:MAG: TrkH family potassium uptake protein [Methanocorpusculum sp.]|nr:TrkH family potassium uptake protein [Methanocorpusculum sp.]
MELIKQLPALGRDLGIGLIFIGLISLAAVAVSCIYQEWNAIIPILTATVPLCVAGIVLRLLPQNGVKPSPKTAIAVTALLWGFVALCGALPFLFADISFTDAVFESMSAWTSTGFSVAGNIEQWPHTLLFWRSLMQWIGALGIVVFALTVASGAGFYRGLYRTEGRQDTFLPSATATALHMMRIYLILTAIAIVAILCTGVGIWDSVNLAFCSISTGGMTMYTDGIAHYQNLALEIVLIPIMFLGAIPFRLYYLSFSKRSLKEMLHDRILQVMFALFVIVSAVLVFDLVINSGLAVGDALREGVFMAGSSLTSTGFQNTDFSLWGFAPLFLLGVFMFIGGPQGSTAGGLKLDRIIVAWESLVWWIKKTVGSSKAVVSMRHERKPVKEEDTASLISGSLLVILCFVILQGIVLFILLHDSYFASDIPATIFDVLNCVANTGASSGMIGPDMPEYSKILTIFVMWIARLEIIPVVILVGGIFRKIIRK